MSSQVSTRRVSDRLRSTAGTVDVEQVWQVSAGPADAVGAGPDVEWVRPADQLDAPITWRAVAMLRAVSDGRAELICSCEPDLVIDGLGCCDQYTAHLLSRAGLIRPVVQGTFGQRVPAELTGAGRAVLAGDPALV